MPAQNSNTRYEIRDTKKTKFTRFLTLTTKHVKGFTLIELMVAISILAIIATIGLNTYTQTQKIARDAKRKQDLRSVAIAIELFYQKNKRFPCSDANWQISNATDWMIDRTSNASSSPGCPGTGIAFAPNYINMLPKDPINTGNNLPSIGTTNYLYGYWQGSCAGVNSYAIAALLENPNDSDTVSKKNQRWCDNGLLVDNYGWNPNVFLISSW